MAGNDFYKKKGLVSIMAHVRPEVRKKLKYIALREERTFQRVVQRILTEAAYNPKTFKP